MNFISSAEMYRIPSPTRVEALEIKVVEMEKHHQKEHQETLDAIKKTQEEFEKRIQQNRARR